MPGKGNIGGRIPGGIAGIPASMNGGKGGTAPSWGGAALPATAGAEAGVDMDAGAAEGCVSAGPDMEARNGGGGMPAEK